MKVYLCNYGLSKWISNLKTTTVNNIVGVQLERTFRAWRTSNNKYLSGSGQNIKKLKFNISYHTSTYYHVFLWIDVNVDSWQIPHLSK